MVFAEPKTISASKRPPRPLSRELDFLLEQVLHRRFHGHASRRYRADDEGSRLPGGIGGPQRKRAAEGISVRRQSNFFVFTTITGETFRVRTNQSRFWPISEIRPSANDPRHQR
jgi:hypothetical protein